MPKVDTEGIEAMFGVLGEKLGIKLRDLTKPFYVAVSGSRASTPLYDSMALLGGDMVRMRLRRAIETLGPVTQAMQTEMERRHSDLFSAEPQDGRPAEGS